jgi:hypothetical protein
VLAVFVAVRIVDRLVARRALRAGPAGRAASTAFAVAP